MLERSLGPGHVRAEAAVEMDYERINETQERFDPDGQVTRSTQTVNSSSKSSEPAAAPTVTNNLPNASTETSGQNGTQETREEETTNYEIGRSVRTLVRDQPSIKRISLAVLVDGVEQPGTDGKPIWQPRPAEELQRLTALVQGAIGYDAKRGDQVQLVSLPFAAQDPGTAAAPATILGLPLDKPGFTALIQTGALALIALAAILFVLRPLARRIAAIPPGGIVPAPAKLLPPSGKPGAAQITARGGERGGTGAGGGSAAAIDEAALPPLLEDDRLVSVAHIEGQMRASSIRKLANLAERHPDETLVIVRGWMAEPG
jgi:flagellar M-ring protein FliF